MEAEQPSRRSCRRTTCGDKPDDVLRRATKGAAKSEKGESG